MNRTGIAAVIVLAVGAAVYLMLTGGVQAEHVLRGPNPTARDADIDEPSDAEIRDILVQESITRYTGSCACPYHRKFNEKLFRFPNDFRNRPTVKCGEESEYLTPGGPTVFCYPSDVPQEMVAEYREHLRSTFLTEPAPNF